ncbi:hypothetical protein B9Z65_3989 [Elsinoe australis]|uniref:C6 transcription factor n=1 Tax=Elsinoe australis TaxID=40998 RepID=A0A2P7Z1I2_9PEZI|nr:hypothetical protein B9Z65_3989 [Elsinoe australis]
MSTQVNIWRDTVVEMGMTHHFLLHGIFALTAVHRATLVPEVADSETLLQADHHISHALGPYRGLLLEPTPEASPSMFVFSTVLSIYTLGSAQLQPAEDPIQTVIQCLRMVRGCSQAIGQNFETITNSEIKPLVENALFNFETMIQPGVPQIHLLLELIKGNDQSSVCVEAAEHLHKVFFHIQQCALLADSDRSTVAIMFTWPTMLAEDFIRLLCDREPISLVVLAHFAVLLCEHHSHWWLGDLGSRVITAIQSRLGSMGGIDEWMAWPLRIAQPQLSH